VKDQVTVYVFKRIGVANAKPKIIQIKLKVVGGTHDLHFHIKKQNVSREEKCFFNWRFPRKTCHSS